MRARVPSRLAWAVCAGVLLLIAGVIVGELNRSSLFGLPHRYGEVVWLLSWAGFPVAGALIVSRRGGNRVGWVMVMIAVAVAGGLAAGVYTEYAHFVADRPPPLTDVVTWLSSWVMTPAFVGLVLLVALFPSGRPAGRLGRLLVVGLLGGMGLIMVGLMLQVEIPVDGSRWVPNPYAPEGVQHIVGPSVGALGTGLAFLAVVAIGQAVVRLVRSRGVERQQRKWFVASAAMFPLLMVVSGLGDGLGWPGDVTTGVAFFVSLNGMAAAIVIAVTRYRLYEIDRFISRTLTYGVVSAVLVLAYLGVVLGVQAVAPVGDQSPLAVAAATLAAAFLFQPVRRRVQHAVDRRFNRARYDAQRIVEEFSQRLRDEVDLDEIRADLLGAVHGAMAPKGASVVVLARETRP